MTLYTESEGNGSALVLIHGWGLHGDVWAPVVKALASQFRVVRVDLPGFGGSAPLACDYTADALAEAVAAVVPHDATWIGWSLGGLVALAGAARGVTMKKLVLVDATPRFVQASDWPCAVEPEVLANFANELEGDFRSTALRFLALQARGSERGREELRMLRETIFARGLPSLIGLRGGLDVLRKSDLRAELSKIVQPTLAIHGERDRLVPQGAAEAMVATLPSARLVSIRGAGHAPFLSHPDEFLRALVPFLHE